MYFRLKTCAPEYECLLFLLDSASFKVTDQYTFIINKKISSEYFESFSFFNSLAKYVRVLKFYFFLDFFFLKGWLVHRSYSLSLNHETPLGLFGLDLQIVCLYTALFNHN